MIDGIGVRKSLATDYINFLRISYFETRVLIGVFLFGYLRES